MHYETYMLNEARIIETLKTEYPDFIGDDAAVLPALPNSMSYVITKDLLIENIHFRTAYTRPEDLAYKVLQVNLSDIAAMGGKPQYILCGAGIPKTYEPHLDSFLTHFIAACKTSGVVLIGGDTTGSPDMLYLSITAIGIIPSERKIGRAHANVGDCVCVAGNLGYAHLGLHALEHQLSGFDTYKTTFLRPQAKVDEGQWLAENGVRTMMDISDGLWIDLNRLCKASSVSAHIALESLPQDEKYTMACQKMGLDAVNTMLTGGEDYSLLCTLPSALYESISAKFIAQFGYPLRRIGDITNKENDKTGVHITEHGHIKHLSIQPFTHFGENNAV